MQQQLSQSAVFTVLACYVTVSIEDCRYVLFTDAPLGMVGKVAKERIKNRERVTSLPSLDVMTPAEYGAWLLYDSFTPEFNSSTLDLTVVNSMMN